MDMSNSIRIQEEPLTLLENVHEGLASPAGCIKATLIKGSYKYYHYFCDGLNDKGWGCGYRTLQTLCSWLSLEKSEAGKRVPRIEEIQASLVKIGDKPDSFYGSKDWIGSVEVALFIDYYYGVPCKIIHIPSGQQIKNHIETIESHFDSVGCPIMMGGDKDASSKGILGVCRTTNGIFLLILDPHYSGKQCSIKKLQDCGWVKWQPLDFFLDSSFYNICLCQYKKQQTKTS